MLDAIFKILELFTAENSLIKIFQNPLFSAALLEDSNCHLEKCNAVSWIIFETEKNLGFSSKKFLFMIFYSLGRRGGIFVFRGNTEVFLTLKEGIIFFNCVTFFIAGFLYRRARGAQFWRAARIDAALRRIARKVSARL